MNRRDLLSMLGATALLPLINEVELGAETPERGAMVYELRIYHTFEGKLDTLLTRFRDHTMTIFKRHGMKSVAYWTPLDEPLAGKTLIYVIEHSSREAATANWKSFGQDPEWVKVQTASEANGKIVEKVESTFMTLTDFSPKV